MVSPVGDYLVFLLHAPLGAMGAVAVGERRGGFDRPGKSAILGLVAAALGLDRDDEESHQALAAGYGLGVGEITTGRLLSDYHTAQMPPQRRNRRFATRRDELAERNDLGTVLSVREYRTEPSYLAVLWRRASPRWTLGELESALRFPHFTLYFGRKACPLGMPLDPRVISADGPWPAIDAYVGGRTELQARVLGALRLDEPPAILALDPDGTADRANAMRVERRRDMPVSRRRWQFGLRSEVVERRGE